MSRLSIPEVKRLTEMVAPLDASWDTLREKLDLMLTNLSIEDAELNSKLESHKQGIVATRKALADIWYDERNLNE